MFTWTYWKSNTFLKNIPGPPQEIPILHSDSNFKFQTNQIPYRLPSSFFLIAVFFGVHFYRQTPRTCLHHTVLLVGVTDPGNSGVFIFESWIYMGISSFSNAHNFVKNLVWTSFYSPFWSSWADLSFAPTFRVWRQILFFLLARLIKATVHIQSCTRTPPESKFRTLCAQLYYM